MLEEEEVAHIEVEEASLQAQVEEAAIKIKVKAQAKIKYKVKDDLIHFEDAVKQEKWVAVMEEEIEAIENNDTWELVNFPQGKQVIGVKWIYMTKSNIEEKIERHKESLVVKRYKQQHGRDYSKTFVPVVRMETVLLKEEVYVAQPLGYEIEGQEDKVYQLRKALCELKQEPRAWYKRIDAYLLDNGFDKCDNEPTLYIKENDDKILIVVLYVDDLIFTGSDDFLIADFKQIMKNEFEMTNLGLLRYVLGIEVKQTENGIFISQAKYVVNIVERFIMQNNKPAQTPTIMRLNLSKEDCSNNINPTLYNSMIGSLMYLTANRPDIMYAVSLVSRFMETPKETHWQAAKRILRYANGTKQASKKQPIVSMSTTEVEYVIATVAVCHAMWMRRMLRDLRHDQEGMTTIFCDNTSAIALSKNLVFHKRTKHIDVKYHFIRELINNDEIVL
eukprot:PITA_14297